MTNSPKSGCDKPPRKVTIYCDKGNTKKVIRKIGFKDEVWMDEMPTGTESTFICESAYGQLMQQAQKMYEALLKHGCHSMECPCLSDTIDGQYNIPCTCGFSDALEQFDEFMKDKK